MPWNFNDEYDQLLVMISTIANNCGKNKFSEQELTTLYPIQGNRYSGELMVIGRAVNGWGENDKLPWKPLEAVDANRRKEILGLTYKYSQKSIDGACPMQWVTDYWGR